jgi:hypothetical protein
MVKNRRNDVTSKILLPRKVTPLDSNTTEVSLSLYLEYTFLGRLLKRSILKRITKMWQNKLESCTELQRVLFHSNRFSYPVLEAKIYIISSKSQKKKS